MTASDEEDRTVIDFGAHLFPESVFPTAAYEESASQGSSFVPLLKDPETFSQRLAAAGIDIGVLSQPYYMGHAETDLVVEANDALLSVIDRYQEYYGLAAIPVAAGGEAAAGEFERCIANGYHGGAIETKTNGIELIDSELEPVFEVAEETGAPLLVHPKLHESLGPDVLDDSYALNAVFGREAALCESLCKVIHDGVLDRFPGLNLVYHHHGGNIASMLGRVHNHLDDGRWAGLHERTKPYSEFKAQLESRIYVDTSGFFGYPAPLRTTLEELPATHVLLGTDFPFEPRTADELRQFVRVVEQLAPRKDARHILGETAADLLVNTP